MTKYLKSTVSLTLATFFGDGRRGEQAAFWQLNPTLMTAVRANAFCHAISPLRLSVSDGSEQSSGGPRFFSTICRSATF